MNLVNHSVIKHKMGLLNLAEELQNISQACRVMGVSRDTFYRVKEAKETGGLEALLHKDRRRPNPKNRVDEVVEQAVLSYALETRPLARFEFPTSCASVARSSAPPACARFGCDTLCTPFACVLRRWRRRWPKKACC